MTQEKCGQPQGREAGGMEDTKFCTQRWSSAKALETCFSPLYHTHLAAKGIMTLKRWRGQMEGGGYPGVKWQEGGEHSREAHL